MAVAKGLSGEFLIRNLIKSIKEGKTPNQDNLKALASLLESAMTEIDAINSGGQKRYTQKTGLILAKKLGFSLPKGRRKEFETLNDLFDSKEYRAAEFFIREKKKPGNKTEALSSAAEKFKVDERTIQRYCAKHKNLVNVILRFEADMNRFREALDNLGALTEKIVSGAQQPKAKHASCQIGRMKLFLRPVTPARIRNLASIKWRGRDNAMKLCDWWGSGALYENLRSRKPVGPQFKISESAAGDAYRFIRSVLTLYDD